MSIIFDPSNTPEDNANTSTLLIPFNRHIFKPETGTDTIILQLPADIVPPRPESPGVNPQVPLLLLQAVQQTANEMGENVRMASFWVSRDPKVIEQRGMSHDCDVCRAGVDQALATMRDDPEAVMAVGLLSYCA